MSTTPHPGQLRAALNPLLGRPISVPSSPGWDQARAAWNLAVDQSPAAVVDAASADDVVAAVRFARGHGMTVAPQGTGHGASTLSLDADTLLLRTSRMNAVAVDPGRQLAHVQAGAQWGEVTAAAAPHGLTALAGSSADVGVLGFLLGGGLSWFARGRGLACQDLLCAEVVTGTGERLRTDEDTRPELLWSLRGGGGSSGVVVLSVDLRLHPIAEVYAGMLLYPLARAAEVLGGYAAWSADAPECATTAVRLLRLPPQPDLPAFLSGHSFVGVTGAVDAPAAEAEPLLAPLRALGPQHDMFAASPTTALAQISMDPPGPVPAAGDGMNLRGLEQPAIDALLAVAGPAVPDLPLLLVDLRHIGGAAGRPHDGNAALTHLDGEFALFTTGITPTPAAVAAVGYSARSVLDGMRPWRASRDYLNFRESAVAPREVHDEPVLARLRAVRAEHDPAAVIRSHHPIA